jgi:hypothetical protein
MDFELGKEYAFDQINDWVKTECDHNTDVELHELGEDLLIGESFISVKDMDNDKTMAFVLSSYNNARGAFYRLVYSDYTKEPMLTL